MNQPQVIQAVAGAGKTTTLVARYVDLVLAQPPLHPRHVAVITFTDAAARELVDRIRMELTQEARGVSGRSEHARLVLTELGGAPIGTIHSLARAILAEHATAIQVPFRVEVREELDELVLKNLGAHLRRSINEWATTYQVAEAGLVRTTKAFGGGHRNVQLHRDGATLIEKVPGAMLRAARSRVLEPAEIDKLLTEAWQELANLQTVPIGVLDHQDAVELLTDLINDFTDLAGPTKVGQDFEVRIELTNALLKGLPTGVGPVESVLKLSRRSWATKPMRTAAAKVGRHQFEERVDQLEAHNEAVNAWQHKRANNYARLAGIHALEAFRNGRNASGQDWLLQDELLQRSLELVLTDPQVQESLRQRYQLVLLDEAQDIDATQMQLLLTMTRKASLMVVGDPQQSIYGFRGANFETFDKLRTQLIGGNQPNILHTNYRSLPIIVEAVNQVFTGYQRHTDLVAHRTSEHGSVTILKPVLPAAPAAASDQPAEKEKLGNRDYRIAQADAMANEVHRFLTDPELRVYDKEEECWRRARPADIAVLVKSRADVASITAALRARGVRTLVRTSRKIATHPTAEGLAAALLAIADSDDTRMLLQTLRSPLFACTDAQITSHVLAHGKLRLRSTDDQGPVGQALAQLLQARTIFGQRGAGVAAAWLTSTQAVQATLTAADPENWAEAWSQIRLLIDTVDDRSRSTTESPTEFAQWLRDTLTLASETNSSVLHEPDATGVTITTVHQAKGLQWPIVVTGATRETSFQNKQLTFTQDDVYTHLTKDYHYGDELVRDEFPESDRLLYVAMTRARDHLVVSDVAEVLRGQSSLVAAVSWGDDVRVVEVPITADMKLAADAGTVPERADAVTEGWLPGVGLADAAHRLAEVQLAATRILRTATPSSAGHSGGHIGIAGNPAVHTDFAGFVAREASVSAALGQPPGTDAPATPASTHRSAEMATTASESAASHQESPAADLAAGIGELVHAVLELVELAEFIEGKVDVRSTTAAVQQAHGWTDLDVSSAVTLLENARHSLVLKRASQAAVLRRELPISGSSLQDDGALVVTQGIIDLLFQDAGDWVLADYKTDSTNRSDAEFIDLYRGQLDAYHKLLDDCGIQAKERWLIRIRPTGVSDIPV